jgi:hypothetical protein
VSNELDITAEYLRSLSYRTLHAGDDYYYKFYVTIGDAPLNLTGSKIWMTIKEVSIKTDAEAKLQLSSAVPTEIEITNATYGEFVVKFTKDKTSDLEGQWGYDLQVKALMDGETKIITVAWGIIEFLPNITRATT